MIDLDNDEDLFLRLKKIFREIREILDLIKGEIFPCCVSEATLALSLVSLSFITAGRCVTGYQRISDLPPHSVNTVSEFATLRTTMQFSDRQATRCKNLFRKTAILIHSLLVIQQRKTETEHFSFTSARTTGPRLPYHNFGSLADPTGLDVPLLDLSLLFPPIISG